jgi:hypothetical protein
MLRKLSLITALAGALVLPAAAFDHHPHHPGPGYSHHWHQYYRPHYRCWWHWDQIEQLWVKRCRYW